MFRRSFASAALALMLAVAPAAAQTTAPALEPSHLQAARDVMDLSGISQNFDEAFAEFQNNTRQLVAQTRPDLAKDTEAVLALLKPEADKRRDEIATASAEAFARRMNEADLKEVATFFRSPVGQRYSAFRTQAIEDIFNLMAPWAIQTSNVLFDRFAEEMRKRGHQL